MARQGVTYEEIELQAETLVAKGQNPTLEKIRRALGDRGSNSTLSKYINEWRGRRAQTSPPIPSTMNLSDPVNQAVNRVWQQLKEETETEMAKVREEARVAVEMANQSKAQIELERNQALHELEILKENQKLHNQEKIDLLETLRRERLMFHWLDERMQKIEQQSKRKDRSGVDGAIEAV